MCSFANENTLFVCKKCVFISFVQLTGKLDLWKEGDTMTEQQSLRDELFPDGMPEPEEFIRALAAYILAQRNPTTETPPSENQATERSETEAK